MPNATILNKDIEGGQIAVHETETLLRGLVYYNYGAVRMQYMVKKDAQNTAEDFLTILKFMEVLTNPLDDMPKWITQSGFKLHNAVSGQGLIIPAIMCYREESDDQQAIIESYIDGQDNYNNVSGLSIGPHGNIEGLKERGEWYLAENADMEWLPSEVIPEYYTQFLDNKFALHYVAGLMDIDKTPTTSLKPYTPIT
jgi:hypothetical protein